MADSGTRRDSTRYLCLSCARSAIVWSARWLSDGYLVTSHLHAAWPGLACVGWFLDNLCCSPPSCRRGSTRKPHRPSAANGTSFELSLDDVSIIRQGWLTKQGKRIKTWKKVCVCVCCGLVFGSAMGLSD